MRSKVTMLTVITWAVTTAAVTTGLGGCAEITSIYHNRVVSGPGARVITIDAKQRNVFLTPIVAGGDAGAAGAAGWRMCAEASPDAFSALSASASLAADVASKSGKAAAAIAENAGTIERTQTVNLLRESMYRTCERYLSGALNPQQFIVQAARDQRSMVAVLAIEQLTRAARPAATILAAPGTSAAIASEANPALITQFSGEKRDTAAALASARATYQAALPAGKCDTVTAAPAAPVPGAAATPPTLTDWTTCTTAKADQAARQASADAASARLDKVLDAIQTGGTTVAGSSAGVSQTGGGAAPTGADLEHVADAVRDIAMAPGIDEPLMFCIAYLSDPVRLDDAVKQSCIDTLHLRALKDEARRDLYDVQVNGESFRFTPYAPPAPGDTARLSLQRYLAIAGNVTEGKRRFALAATGAQIIGIRIPGGDLIAFLSSGTAREHRVLLDWLRTNDPTPAAQAVLTGP